MAGALLSGTCPPPFLDLADFPYTGGFNASRLCSKTPLGPTCCLPCPLTDWVYPDNFHLLSTIASWIAVFSLACCAFLLLSFVVLPVQKTSRHYLTICLVVGVGLLMLSYVVPLASRPARCHDKITPHDMYSDLSCAFSGSLILFGGFASVMWVFIRSLSLHLQICWQVSTGRKFFFASLLGGWGIPALSLGLSLALSGVSYRFGNTCHINHEKSLGAFWIPLLVFTGLAAILQLVTFAYCIRVYLQNLMDSNTASATSSNLPSHHGGSSIRTASARAAYRRIRKVVALQWRGIMVVIIMIISVVDFSIVFLKLDAMQAQAQEAGVNGGMRPWLACLVANRGDKNKCLDKIDGVILSEPIIVATIYLLSFLGFWCLLFLGRVAMASGWLDVLRRPFRPRDFVSVDARRLSLSDPRNYEMLTSPQSNVESPGKKSPGAPLLAFSKEIASPSLGASPQSASDYFPARETAFRERSLSFSQPRPPSRAASKGSQRVTFSREGPSSPPLDAMPKNWSSMTGDTDTTAWPSLVAPSSPKPQQEQPHQQQHWQSHSQRHSPNLHQQQHHQQSPPQTAPAHAANSSLWERSSSALSNGSRSGSALGREYAGAALGREWLRTSPVPAGPPPLRRTNSALGRDREWDPRTTYARGTGAGAGDHGAF